MKIIERGRERVLMKGKEKKAKESAYAEKKTEDLSTHELHYARSL